MKYLLVLSFFLVGCNQQMKQSDPRTITGINPAFNECVNRFETLLGHSIGDIPIQFEPQQGNVVGECTVWNSQWKQIVIDPTYWNEPGVDLEEQCSLIVHELGHCVLNRGHIDTDQPFNGTDGYTWSVRTSFMSPWMFFNKNYPNHNIADFNYLKNYYYYELFHPAPGSPTMTDGDEVQHYTDTRPQLKH